MFPAHFTNYQRPYFEMMQHHCGMWIQLHPDTACLYARCPNWFKTQTCQQCGIYRPVSEFKWPNGKTVGE